MKIKLGTARVVEDVERKEEKKNVTGIALFHAFPLPLPRAEPLPAGTTGFRAPFAFASLGAGRVQLNWPDIFLGGFGCFWGDFFVYKARCMKEVFD